MLRYNILTCSIVAALLMLLCSFSANGSGRYPIYSSAGQRYSSSVSMMSHATMPINSSVVISTNGSMTMRYGAGQNSTFRHSSSHAVRSYAGSGLSTINSLYSVGSQVNSSSAYGTYSSGYSVRSARRSSYVGISALQDNYSALQTIAKRRDPGVLGGEDDNDNLYGRWESWYQRYLSDTGSEGDLSGLEDWWNRTFGSGYPPDIFSEWAAWVKENHPYNTTPIGDGVLALILMLIAYIGIYKRNKLVHNKI